MAQLPSNSFDIVVCNMALMMIKRYDDAVKEVARVLKPKGIFVFSITHPCFWTPGCEWIVTDTKGTGREEKIGWKVDNYHLRPVARWVITGCSQKETYLFYRTLEDYFRALRKNGFVVEDLREPLPPKELMEKDPQFEAELKRSVFLVVKSVLLET